MVMTTLETLDNLIIDEYKMDEMETWKSVDHGSGENGTNGPLFIDYPCLNDVYKSISNAIGKK